MAAPVMAPTPGAETTIPTGSASSTRTRMRSSSSLISVSSSERHASLQRDVLAERGVVELVVPERGRLGRCREQLDGPLLAPHAPGVP